MATSDRLHGLAAAATISAKAVNQDAQTVAVNPRAALAAVIVADGLGSNYGAEVASAIVADTIAAWLDMLSPDDDLDLQRLFADAHGRLRNEIEERLETLPPDLDWNNAFGTTAICAVEMPNVIACGYVGNGGIFHLRGNFNTFPSSQLLPWNALNVLNPHSISVGGKNVLYKTISPRSKPEDVTPSVVIISKDEVHFGDIVVCCTDGIYSYDQVPIGRDDRQRIWISGEAAMARLYESLARFFDGVPSREALQASLDDYLASLLAGGFVNDDCTVAVLITEKTLAYQSGLRDRREESVTA